MSEKDVESLSRSKDQTWYVQGDPDIPSETRDLFEHYSKIAPGDVLAHAQEIRDKAWDIFPFPCIGTYRFLQSSITRDPYYKELLHRLKSTDDIYLDLGCALGQDIRRLVYDGVPSERTYGSDLQKPFMDLGYDLFRDKETLKTTFIEADVFNDDSDLKQLYGKVSVIQASAFFHLFDYEPQKQVARRCVQLLMPQVGVTVFGQQAGCDVAGRSPHRRNKDKFTFRHNAESWTKFWDEIGEETGTRWRTEAILRDIPSTSKFMLPKDDAAWQSARWLLYKVTRTE